MKAILYARIYLRMRLRKLEEEIADAACWWEVNWQNEGNLLTMVPYIPAP